jgi:hypothetical protein
MYNKYASVYPNLILSYGDSVQLNPAVELKFYTNENDSILHYRVLGNGETLENGGVNVATLISSNGPLKEAMAVPYKDSSAGETYTFSGYWIDKETGIKYYVPGDVISPSEGTISFADLIPLKDMEFYPEYITSIRQYSVRFYTDKAILIPQVAPTGETYDEWLVDYNTIYNGPMQEYYYKSSDDLSEYMRYTFIGWSKRYYDRELDEIPEVDRVSLSTLVIQNNVNLYACYRVEDVRNDATESKYFEFVTINNEYGVGKAIGIKDEYRNTLEGKITLPSLTPEGEKIISIYDLKNTTKITHIFFTSDAQYTSVYPNGFYGSIALTFVDLPNSIRRIGDYAFATCFNLKHVSLNDNITYIGQWAFSSTNSHSSTPMQIEINKLPEQLETLGAFAFCYGGDGVKITSLPKTLKAIYTFTFNDCDNVYIDTFGSNDGSTALWHIAQNAMANCGKNYRGVKSVSIYESIKVIGQNAFNEYLTNDAHYYFYRLVDTSGNTEYYAEVNSDNTINYSGKKSHPDMTISGNPEIVSMGIPTNPTGDPHYTYIAP